MIERGGGARLLLETPQAVRVGGKRCRQNLDGDVAVQARVARAIDLAHAAGAEWAPISYGPSFVPGARVMLGGDYSPEAISRLRLLIDMEEGLP